MPLMFRSFIARSFFAVLLSSVTVTSMAGTTRYYVSHFAGSTGGPGYFDATGSGSRFNNPSGVAVDSSGNVYVADTYNHVIRKVSPSGVTTTLAGTAGLVGSADGTGATARFRSPMGVALDSSGNLYVADSSNHAIRKVTASGVTTTLAGAAQVWGSDDGTGSDARFKTPTGVAVDSSGFVYVADSGNHLIRKISPAGVTTTLAGYPGTWGSVDGTGADVLFSTPSGVAVDGAGYVYVADSNNRTVRKISPTGVTTTLVGNAGASGSADGTGSAAQFSTLAALAVDGSGYLYIADRGNQTIRKVSPAGVTTTLAGSAGLYGFADATGSAARFYSPEGVAVDSSGNVYVGDWSNHAIRKISSAGVVTTLAGSTGLSGSTDGSALVARFSTPGAVTTDVNGNLYVAESASHTIRKITPSGETTTLAGLAGSSGSADGVGSAARFSNPRDVATDRFGNVYVADYNNHTIRKITPTGETSTIAGTAGEEGFTDGSRSEARFTFPITVAVDQTGNVFSTDVYSRTVRKITPGGETTTLAGALFLGGSKDGTGAEARFLNPLSLAVDTAGNVYVSDSDNHKIRKITPAGVTTTLAGSGSYGSEDGTGAAAKFGYPTAIKLDGAGNVYVAQRYNALLRKVSPSGVTTTLSVVPNGALPIMDQNIGIAIDQRGDLYQNDYVNHAIRKLTLRGTRADFLGSAGTDLVWQNTTTGQRGLWIMDGVSFMSWVDLGTVPIAWRIAGTADFNLDGSPDIVWENTSTGERGAWLMNNTAFSSWLSLGTVPTAWRIAQVGASDAGDKTYLLWENTTTGERYIWTYTGTTFTSSTFLGVVPTDWKMVGFGDLNADTYNDLVWENTTTGERGVWFLNSSLSYTGWQSLGIIPTEWHIAGLADYNADDKLDLLWENTSTGQRLVWHLDGTSYSSTGLIGSAPAEWRVTN